MGWAESGTLWSIPPSMALLIARFLVFRNVGILFLVSGFEIFDARSTYVPSAILGATSLISLPAWVGREGKPACDAGLIEAHNAAEW